MSSPLIEASDKVFWHRFIEFYEPFMKKIENPENILEFGVFHGHSIAWFHDRFPQARIVGCDILDVQPEWPRSERIEYRKVDQNDVTALDNLFEDLGRKFDLVIEDGSHLPRHQRNCLLAALPRVRSGGIYILEDLHTSHPAHEMYQKLKQPGVIGPLHLLLAIEHIKTCGLASSSLKQLGKNSLFDYAQIMNVYERVSSINLYKRAALPLRCWRCGASEFNYHDLRCACGAGLYSEDDSMTAVIIAA